MDYYALISENQIKKYEGEQLKKFAGNRMIKYVANPTDADMAEFGFKPLQTTEMPIRDGYYYVAKYTDNGQQIVQTWDEFEVVEEEMVEGENAGETNIEN